MQKKQTTKKGVEKEKKAKLAEPARSAPVTTSKMLVGADGVVIPEKIEKDEFTADDFVIPVDKDLKSEKYYEAMGRRKTAVARVRFYTRGDKQFLVNNKPYQEYFPHPEFQEIAIASLKKMKCLDRFRILAKVTGGGPHAQAEAIRHGTARVLVGFNPNFRKRLRKAGYLTRDPRMRERKKFGLKRARRAPQWSKR